MTAIALQASSVAARSRPIEEPVWVRLALIGLALAFLTLFLFIPLISVFYEALKKGWGVYIAAITKPVPVSAIHSTLAPPASASPLNLFSGLAPPWATA